jgi:hypothetical protein
VSLDLDWIQADLGPPTVDLAASLSLAAFVDPALLRTVRRELHPQLEPAAEAVLFHSALVDGAGAHGFNIVEAALGPLRARLVAGGRLDAAWTVTRRVHGTLAPLTCVEEELTYLLLAGDDPGRVDELLRSVVRLLRDPDERGPAARWIMRSFRRQPDALFAGAGAGQALALAHAASAVLGGRPFGRPVAAIAGSVAVAPLPVLVDGVMAIGLAPRAEGLMLTGRPTAAAPTIDVPRAWPVTLLVEHGGGELTVVLHGPHDRVILPIELPAVLTTMTGARHRVAAETITESAAAPVGPTVYALLVGIDGYQPPIPANYGCRNDIDALATFLQARVSGRLELRVLYDADATREAIVAGWHDHLGQAGSGDVALFAFAGHGSQEPAPVEAGPLADTTVQGLVPYDAGRRRDGRLVRMLADPELHELMRPVGEAGAQVCLILDCGFQGSGSRDVEARARGVDFGLLGGDAEKGHPRPGAERHPDEFLGGITDSWRQPSFALVALTASGPGQRAMEHMIGSTIRGVFSAALVDALEVSPPSTTYRSLIDSVGTRIGRMSDQRPQMVPADAGILANALLFQGLLEPNTGWLQMTRTGSGWQVDGGHTIGLRAANDDDAFVLTCRTADGVPAGTVRVTTVDVATAGVEPIEWTPADEVYRAAVVDVPTPPADLALDAAPKVLEEATAAAHDAVRRAVATAGPGGEPSRDVQIVESGEARTGFLRLRLGVPAEGALRILRTDGTAATADVVVGERGVSDLDGAARRAVATIAHIARWERIRGLGSHPSPLADSVAMDVYLAEAGETRLPPNRTPLPAAGDHRFEYVRDPDGGWRPPSVFVRLVNRWDQPLFAAVLDLTDRFACVVLQHAVQLKPLGAMDVLDGQNLTLTLPDGRAVEPGASARDWLQLIVSDAPFDASAFELGPLGEPSQARTRPADDGVLERLATRAIDREAGGYWRRDAALWSARTVALEVVVPPSDEEAA